jgi:hypothetical protein
VSDIEKRVDRIEQILQPRGRCLDCGGGEGYWKHPSDHPFRSPMETEPPPPPHPTERFAIRFERIGRTHDAPPLELEYPVSLTDEQLADEMAEAIFRYCRKYLISNEYSVVFELREEDGEGTIGAGRYGAFTITSITKATPYSRALRKAYGRVND